jgi:hypothetical protein
MTQYLNMPNFFREYLEALTPERATLLYDWMDGELEADLEIITVIASKVPKVPPNEESA